MSASSSLIITTIASPNKALATFAKECSRHEIDFIVVGDRRSPPDFSLPGADFWSIERQMGSGFKTAIALPENHYARKNIGYLAAIERGHELILETDDDNLPYENFWYPAEINIPGKIVQTRGWINIFSMFSDEVIWPRGFPLEYLDLTADYETGTREKHFCPIQQGLANDNPDVDAVFRLTRKLPVVFQPGRTFIIGKGNWCPFNSQNTVWFREAFPLMYLPSYCTFRMTDIWRSFVAQRIAWEYGWKIAFYSPTVYQERNEHNLLGDFEDEVPGYLNNAAIGKALESLKLSDRRENMCDNLSSCYELLIEMNLVGPEEMPILKQWIYDLRLIL